LRPITSETGNGIFAQGLDKWALTLDVSVPFLRLEISRGRLRPTRLGRRLLVTTAEINRYLAENTQSPTALV